MNNSKLNEILNENNIDARKVSRKEYNEIVKKWKTLQSEATNNSDIKYISLEITDETAFAISKINSSGVCLSKEVIYTSNRGMVDLIPYLKNGFDL